MHLAHLLHCLHLRGLVGSPDGARVIRDEIRGPLAEGEALGHTLARRPA